MYLKMKLKTFVFTVSIALVAFALSSLISYKHVMCAWEGCVNIVGFPIQYEYDTGGGYSNFSVIRMIMNIFVWWLIDYLTIFLLSKKFKEIGKFFSLE